MSLKTTQSLQSVPSSYVAISYRETLGGQPRAHGTGRPGRAACCLPAHSIALQWSRWPTPPHHRPPQHSHPLFISSHNFNHGIKMLMQEKLAWHKVWCIPGPLCPTVDWVSPCQHFSTSHIVSAS